MSDFIWGGFKITADGDCSHEIKRHLFLGKKVMINLNSTLKSIDMGAVLRWQRNRMGRYLKAE